MKIFALSILSLARRAIAFGVAGSILAAGSIFAQEQPVEKIAQGELPSLLAIYKDIHSHPELSTREEKTSALVAKELRATGCEVTENFGKYDNPNLKCYGVVGMMKNGTGPTVLVRTDMDALPVEEDTGLPYASKVTAQGDDGREVHVMHACGHDAHMSAFIGTARALQRLKDRWSGTIVFIGQPAEETVGGARALLKAGLYDRFGKPDFALGYHDNAQMQTGHIGVTEGYTYANVDSVELTVRTYKADVRDRVLAAIDRITKACATAAGIPPERAPIVEVLKDQFTPATYNNPELTKRLVAMWKKQFGAENVEATDPTMGGEDFSEYSLPDHSIPAVDFHIGAVDPAKIADSKKNGTVLPSLHSNKFAPVAEPTIRVGIIAMTAAVLELMKK